jgi:hypothetical protein
VIADGEPGYAGTYRGDHAGALVAEHNGYGHALP